MANNRPTQLTTGEVRISYEHLLRPHATQPNTEAKFSATLLIPKSDFATKQRIDAAIQAAIQEGITSKWGGVRPAQPPVPIYDGDGLRPTGEAFTAECKGHWVMTASSRAQPEVVDLGLQPILNATEIYSGMYARVNINFFAYFNSGKKGIGCGLGPVQKTRDGEPLGNRVSASDAFTSEPAYGYQQPAYQQPAYQQQGYSQPTYQQSAYQQPAYPQQQPVYQPPVYQTPQQQAYQQQSQGIDPITGKPIGGVMGI
jgi:hypothetical protein